MLNILSYLNDVMHITQIVGYPVSAKFLSEDTHWTCGSIAKDNLTTLGQMRLRGENCLIAKEKRRGTVYTRTKTSTRDVFLFERVILLCKKKDDGNGRSVQYQFKELIEVTDERFELFRAFLSSSQITDIAVCTHPKNDRKKIEILLKDYSYIIQVCLTTVLAWMRASLLILVPIEWRENRRNQCTLDWYNQELCGTTDRTAARFVRMENIPVSEKRIIVLHRRLFKSNRADKTRVRTSLLTEWLLCRRTRNDFPDPCFVPKVSSLKLIIARAHI